MAVTYDRVTLSLINYNMFKYAFSDGLYPRYPAITTFSANPANDLGNAIKSSVFKAMLAAGIDNMNLYDNNQNVIGSIVISQYITQYVTFEQLSGSSDEQTSTSTYPAYRNVGDATYGIKYKRIYVDPNYSHIGIKVAVTLNGNTITRILGDSIGAIEIHEQYGTGTSTISANVLSGGGNYPKTLGLMSKTTGGVEHKYLDVVALGAVADEYEWGIDSVEHETALLADNLNITDYIVEEDGYVNELLNRFSPRFWTNCVGMYMIPASTGSDRSGIESVMKMLQEFDITDLLVKSWVGTDGKEYVINLRWYFGLNNAEYVKKSVDRVAMQIGPVLPTASPVEPGEDPAYYYEDVAISEFAVWHTSELFVAPHFDNYLDMLTSYQLYLPYYGFLSLDPNDVVGARLKIYYNINLFTGHCDIIVTTKSSRTNNKEEKTYSVSCVVGEDIPFTTEMYQSMGLILGQRIKEAAGVLSSYAKGDMKGMLDAVGLDSSKVSRGKTDAGTDDTDDASDKTSTLNQVINVANSVLGTTPKPTPTPARSGNFSAETGTLEDLFPYLLVTRPISAAPSNYEEYDGIPSFKTANLGSISGFTKIAAVAPRSMVDAPKYVNEILSLLQAGVYL